MSNGKEFQMMDNATGKEQQMLVDRWDEGM